MSAYDTSRARWRKSSRSGSNGGACVEVALNLVGTDWHKSSRSGSNGGNCVEVARNLPNIVAVRDSKNPAGPTLTVDPSYWSSFTATLKSARSTCSTHKL